MTEPISKEKLLEQAKRYLDEGRIDRAVQEYQKIVAADPRDYRVKLRIAELYIRLKQITEAVRVYQEVANAYSDEGFYLKAVTVYKNILRLNPSLREINGRLADLYEKMGLNQDAINQYHILISVYEQKGDHKGLLDLRRRIVSLDPTNVTNRIRLAEAYQIDGQDQACLQEYETLAEQLKDGGATDQLIDLYEKILTRRPDHLELLQRLCRIYYQAHEYKKALRRIEASQAVVSKDPELAEMQADIYYRLNQMETAKGKWRDLIDLYHSMGAVEQALAACERILTIAPEEADDLREVMEGIKANGLEEVKQRAALKRQVLAQEESEREALETARQEAAAQIAKDEPTLPPTREKSQPVKPAKTAKAVELIRPSGPLKPTEVEALQSKAKASEGLAAMYAQMGLTDEAAEETTKALEVYRRLLVAGIGGTEMLERVRRIEGSAPVSEGPTVPPPIVKPVEPVPVPKKSSPPEQKKASTTPSGGSPSKKRISFV